jgi:hypothetical protein
MNGEITQRILYSLYFEMDLGKIKNKNKKTVQRRLCTVLSYLVS